MSERIINCRFCGVHVITEHSLKEYCSKRCILKDRPRKKRERFIFPTNTIPPLDGEIWLPVVGFEGFYAISNFGRAMAVNRTINGGRWGFEKRKEKLLAQSKAPKLKYKYVILSKEGKTKTMKIHRMVAMAFIPNPDNKPHVNHKDLDKTNNHVDNLEWATTHENRQHAVSNGHCNKGESVFTAVLNAEKVKELRYIYKRGICNILELCKIYNVISARTIRYAINKQSWKHI
jgi:hypothetical protein